MRTAIAALTASTLLACAAENGRPEDRVTLERVERTFVDARSSSKPVRAAAGHVFVIVHLIEDPGTGTGPEGVADEERRDWSQAAMEDWDGRSYRPRSTSTAKSESGTQGLFGRKARVVHPDRTQIVFEVPQTAMLRRLTIPDPIALSEKPVRFRERGLAPRLVHSVEPNYPEQALRNGIDGLVKLEVLVTSEGKVGGARLIHGPRILGDAAADAVRQWKYEPLVVDGKAVPALIEVRVTFRRDS